MLIPGSSRPAAVVTTSWDDGHVSDLRLAELLDRYGLRGTFYVPFRAVREPLMSEPQLRELVRGGMEIGGHTLTHLSMKGLGFERSVGEVRESKAKLEDLLGREVTSFCYPNGDLDRHAWVAVKQEGYKLGRTTVNFRTDLGDDPWRMPVSLQFYPHSAYRRMRIFGRNRDLPGLLRWTLGWGCRADLDRLIDGLFEQAVARGGVFHLWGHSWELDEFDLWEPLESALARIAKRSGVQYLTNTESLEAVSKL